jgi:hypothetical protein
MHQYALFVFLLDKTSSKGPLHQAVQQYSGTHFIVYKRAL